MKQKYYVSLIGISVLACLLAYLYINKTSPTTILETVLNSYIEMYKEKTLPNPDSIEIKKLTSREQAYMVTIGEFWDKQLFVYYSTDEPRLDSTDMSGLKYTFNQQEINITQGDFIQYMSVGHMGMGSMILISVDSPYDIKYTIPGAVDQYHERTATKTSELELDDSELLNIEIDDEGFAVVSKVYDGNCLTPNYYDYNNDGFTDIIMTGLEKSVIHTDDGFEDIVYQVRYCKYVYLYDESLDQFNFSEEDSIYEIVDSL